ncbi:Copper chaperone domain-containing protein [Dioscorea alata]|uniref:Copper chaperone domain-containing protein n=1 Tax=Dioscorea alata TaxID=55571 RepID=A0ACB7W7H0_DIOAL|nr:Copper chaperone domain-containing protein [Dioscorea alata]
MNSSTMGKEDDLKIVQLKVSVNCCEGCKRKVLKALSIKGVLKTEIHPTLPKVTVYGSVDVDTLIKKLAKRGKTAELWSSESIAETNPDINQDHKVIETVKKNKDSSSSMKDYMHMKDINSEKQSETSMSDASNTTFPTAFTPAIPPNMPSSMMVSHARVFYPMEPSTVPMAYYIVSPQYNCYAGDHGHYPYQVPVYHHHHHSPPPPPQPPVMQPQITGFSDYFNDDNTVGCRVM